MPIPQSFIQDLLARADIAELVGRHVQLKKTGINYSGLCPFHGEKTPSFTVSPAKQFYHCFGCGKNGNALGFLMDFAGMNFVDAVKDLAGQYGMQVPEDDVPPEERARAAQQRAKQATLSDVLEKAGKAYRRHLKDTPKAVAYLKGRGLSGEVARVFGLGYAPEGWRSLASVFPSYDDPLLAESGLVIVNEEDDRRYDRFRDRIMFPIRNVKGECIGFGGRVLGDEKPKYLNSPETPVFSKGRELYGLYEARHALREHGYALVTEGYMDVVALAQLGFPNAVATLGTACTAEHVQKLFRFTDSVVFSFDGDAAGRRAARKALEGALPFATDTRTVRFLFLPQEHDPDSFIRERGRQAFADAVGQALPLSRFLIEASAEGCDLDTAEGRARLASNARPLWGLLPDGALKRQLLGEFADLVQLGSHELADLWNLARQGGRGGQGRRAGAGQGGAGGARRPRREAPPPAAMEMPMDDGPPPMLPGDDWPPPPEDAAGGYDTWTPPADSPAGSFSGAPGGKRRFPGKGGAAAAAAAARRGVPGRHLPSSRAGRAVQIVLTEPLAWERLGQDEHQLLCDLAAPHGDLFRWIDSQHHDHGPQPWSALREALRGHALESFAVAEVGRVPPDIESDPKELESILALQRQARDDAEMKRLAAAAATDPAAMEQYKALLAARKTRAGS